MDSNNVFVHKNLKMLEKIKSIDSKGTRPNLDEKFNILDCTLVRKVSEAQGNVNIDSTTAVRGN